MANNLDGALAEGNGEKAVRLYFDLVDQAYGKATQSLEVRAAHREELEAMSDEQLAAELAALRKRLAFKDHVRTVFEGTWPEVVLREAVPLEPDVLESS